MSKFIRWGFLAGILMILVGSGISAAAAAMGVSFHKLENMFREREIFTYNIEVNCSEVSGLEACAKRGWEADGKDGILLIRFPE